jgi:hypothetical protein
MKNDVVAGLHPLDMLLCFYGQVQGSHVPERGQVALSNYSYECMICTCLVNNED